MAANYVENMIPSMAKDCRRRMFRDAATHETEAEEWASKVRILTRDRWVGGAQAGRRAIGR